MAKNSLKDKLELRKKQFHLLVQCVHQLQDMLTLEGHHDEKEVDEGEKTACCHGYILMMQMEQIVCYHNRHLMIDVGFISFILVLIYHNNITKQ